MTKDLQHTTKDLQHTTKHATLSYERHLLLHASKYSIYSKHNHNIQIYHITKLKDATFLCHHYLVSQGLCDCVYMQYITWGASLVQWEYLWSPRMGHVRASAMWTLSWCFTPVGTKN